MVGEGSSKINNTRTPSPENSKSSRRVSSTHFLHLNPDCLVNLSLFLDEASTVSFLRTCRTVHSSLWKAAGFWKGRCLRRGLMECPHLLQDDDEEVVGGALQRPKKKTLAYSGVALRDVVVGREDSLWRKVYLRGFRRQRNINQGRFQLHRFLFPIDQEETLKDLIGDDGAGRTPMLKSWNGDYLVVLIKGHFFVWNWTDRRDNPRLSFSVAWRKLFQGVFNDNKFPSAFLLCKNFLVVMPNPYFLAVAGTRGYYSVKIRAYDLSDKLALVGSLDLPAVPLSLLSRHRDFPHLQLQEGEEDKLVLLCRNPQFKIFVLGVPDCGVILREVSPLPSINGDALELYLLQLGSLSDARDGTFAYTFQDMGEGEDEANLIREQWVLLVDLLDEDLPHRPPLLVYSQRNRDLGLLNVVSGLALLSEERLACSLTSFPRVLLRDFSSSSSFRVFNCPYLLGGSAGAAHPPTLHVSKSGDVFAEMRCFGSEFFDLEWRVHVFARDGSLLYTVAPTVTAGRRQYGLDTNLKVTAAIDDEFLYVTDGESVARWRCRTGVYKDTLSRTTNGGGGAAYQAFRFVNAEARHCATMALVDGRGGCGIMLGYESVKKKKFSALPYVAAEVLSFW